MTPRTDRVEAKPIGFYSCSTVPASFARELEGQLQKAEFCLRLYHEAWNGAEGDWHTPMRIASRDTRKYFHQFHPEDYKP